LEHGVCIECGTHSPLRLPRRFPHICTDCFFPQTATSAMAVDDVPEAARAPHESMTELLHALAKGGRRTLGGTWGEQA
jgi:hypothetical protein